MRERALSRSSSERSENGKGPTAASGVALGSLEVDIARLTGDAPMRVSVRAATLTTGHCDPSCLGKVPGTLGFELLGRRIPSDPVSNTGEPYEWPLR